MGPELNHHDVSILRDQIEVVTGVEVVVVVAVELGPDAHGHARGDLDQMRANGDSGGWGADRAKIDLTIRWLASHA
jgi:hypothetical protein